MDGITVANHFPFVQPSQQLSQIEKSVTHLLIATKQLLETLTQWSRHTATEGEVSDVYVRLGYEFNIACRAFTVIGVDTADLGPVPELLRAILEETLSQEASPASLDRFLPRIRDIIITLLHGLKRKQQRLRAKSGKDNALERTLASAGSSGTLNTGLTEMLEDAQPSRRSGGKGSDRRVLSGSTISDDSQNGDVVEDRGVPPRFPSAQPIWHNSGGVPTEGSGRNTGQESQRSSAMPPPQISTTNLSSQIVTAMSPYAEAFHREPAQRENPLYSAPHPPPPPPPKQQDALAALQRGGDLERRASRRYSAYQISKHLGASPNGVPMLPPAQNSPIPNRGRDVRESMNAVRVRGSGIHSRQKSNVQPREPSPAKSFGASNRISEESSQSSGISNPNAADLRADDSPMTKTPDDKLRRPDVRLDDDYPRLAATQTGPTTDEVADLATEELPENEDFVQEKPQGTETLNRQTSSTTMYENRQAASSSPAQSQQFVPEQSPQPGKELTVFLQYKTKIKKFVLPEGSTDLSIARLQLAFIEKFAWNTHSNGIDLPEIYIQDPVSGVRHELEDLNDVKDRSVLVLNIEVLDEVKRHIDEGLGGLRRMVEGVRTVIDGQQSVMQQVSEQQLNTTKEVARLAASPSKLAGRITSFDKPKVNGILRSSSLPKGSSNQVPSVRSLQQDLAVMRQTFSSLVTDINSSMTKVQSKAATIKTLAIEGAVPSLDSSTGRSYVNAGKKTLGEDSEKIVNRVDDLQDIVEDLRKDVVTRGVRPLPRQLETVSKSISIATSDLKKMLEFLKREKPIWTKIWEKELELVCTDRDLLTMQEELAADLEDDLEKATQTFALVEQATKQQNLQSSQGGPTNLRAASRGLNAIATDQEIDPQKAKDGVLGEVRALRPNHETRLEAIERAEKARQRELESRQEGEFTKELGTFVEEGKLKKSGGVEEAERLRKAKDEKNRREAWDKQQERTSKGAGAENAPPVPEQSDATLPVQDGEFNEVTSMEPGAVGAESTRYAQNSSTGPSQAADDASVEEGKLACSPCIFYHRD
jgi:hypothetical protein